MKAGLPAIYLSGWQVAADANLSGRTYPDQSLYPANSVPAVVRRLNHALRRADQIAWSSGDHDGRGLAPIVADAEAGFGGTLNAFELMTAMIEAGAAGVHEDQLASEKCGHRRKVLVPTEQFVRTLTAARLAADVADVPTVSSRGPTRCPPRSSRPTSTSATDRSSPASGRPRVLPRARRDRRGDRPRARVRAVRGPAVVRDLHPDLDEARVFAEAILDRHPDRLLAYNCSPSFNWKQHLDDDEIGRFRKRLAAMGTASSSSRWRGSTR